MEGGYEVDRGYVGWREDVLGQQRDDGGGCAKDMKECRVHVLM